MLHKLKFTAVLSLLIFASLLFPQLSAHAQDSALFFDTSITHERSILALGPYQTTVYEPSRSKISLLVTAYNSEPGQTDNSPFLTAFGTQTRDGIIATNYLPGGTRVRFPDLYGDKIFVVEDRMNIRYHKRADIWMQDKQDAREFGLRYLRMEIL